MTFKNLLHTTIATFIIALSSFLISCSKDDNDKTEHSLVALWQAESSKTTFYFDGEQHIDEKIYGNDKIILFHFEKDGNFTLTSSGDKGMSGRYTYDATTKSLKTTPDIIDGMKVVFKVIELTDSTLVIELYQYDATKPDDKASQTTQLFTLRKRIDFSK